MIISSPMPGSLAPSPAGCGVRRNSQSPIRSRAGPGKRSGHPATQRTCAADDHRDLPVQPEALGQLWCRTHVAMLSGADRRRLDRAAAVYASPGGLLLPGRPPGSCHQVRLEFAYPLHQIIPHLASQVSEGLLVPLPGDHIVKPSRRNARGRSTSKATG